MENSIFTTLAGITWVARSVLFLSFVVMTYALMVGALFY